MEKVFSIENQLDDLFNHIWEKYRSEFQKKVKGPRLTSKPEKIDPPPEKSIKQLKYELDYLYDELNKKIKEDQIYQNLNLVSQKLNLLKELNLNLNEISNKISVQIDELSREKIKNRVSALRKEIKALDSFQIDIDEWYEKGYKLLKIKKDSDKRCPLCNTYLENEIDTILSEYSYYFSNEIVSLNKYLDEIIDYINYFINEGFEFNRNLISEIKTLLSSNSITLDIDFIELDEEIFLVEKLKELKKLLKLKKENPSQKLFFTSDLSEYKIIYDQSLLRFKNKIREKIKLEKDKIGGKTEKDIVNNIKIKIKELVKAEFNDLTKTVIKNSKKKNFSIAKICQHLSSNIQQKIVKLKSNRAVEIAKLNAESKFVNLYLGLLGITKFSIRIKKESEINNIIISYNDTPIQKESLKFSLSESEKTAMAFAYFISKIRVEKLEGTKNGLDDCIIVIDDPVSSFDENRLFHTANLIVSFFFYSSKIPFKLNFFLLSHNIMFLKYFYNALISNQKFKEMTNEYYLSPYSPQITKIPNGLRNFTNTYILKLNDIISFVEKKEHIIYEDARKYIPNYIRVVLESFLSFKLAIVKDSNNSLPGLAYLINKMISLLEKSDDYIIDQLNKESIIKRLNHLKQISDHESHGNISRIETISFISESELRKYCLYTIQVIKYLDSIHFQRVKSLS